MPIAAITAIGSLAGVGLSAIGTMNQMSAQKKSAAANADIAAQEARAAQIQQQQMELQARRQTLETIRNAQVGRSVALNAAESQGAMQGSGLQGGYGQIQGQEGFNLTGINQSLQLGQQMAGVNTAISGYRGQIAGYGAQQAYGQGLSSFGGSIMSALPAIGRIGGSYGGGYGNTYGV